MDKRVFVSHASQDKQTAEEVCVALEKRGVRCWIAPRDVPAGKDYAEAIVEAIEGCFGMVVILSGAGQDSDFVRSEVERAFVKSKKLYPFYTDDAVLSRRLELFLAASQSIVVPDLGMEGAIELLTDSIKGVQDRETAVAKGSSARTATRRLVVDARKALQRVQKARLLEIENEVRTAKTGDVRVLESFLDELQEPGWLVEPPEELSRQVQKVLAAERARELASMLWEAYSARDYDNVHKYMIMWEDHIQQGEYVPDPNIVSMVREVEEWCLSEEGKRQADFGFREAKANLSIALDEGGASREELERLMYRVAEFNREIPEGLRRRAERAILLSRIALRRRTMLVLAFSVGVFVIFGAVGGYVAHRITAGRRLERSSEAFRAAMKQGDLEEALRRATEYVSLSDDVSASASIMADVLRCIKSVEAEKEPIAIEAAREVLKGSDLHEIRAALANREFERAIRLLVELESRSGKAARQEQYVSLQNAIANDWRSFRLGRLACAVCLGYLEAVQREGFASGRTYSEIEAAVARLAYTPEERKRLSEFRIAALRR